MKGLRKTMKCAVNVTGLRAEDSIQDLPDSEV
jgi:hypothetical protein